MNEAYHVRQANRIFFDTVADVYEEIDGRRDPHLMQWLDPVMADLAARTGGGGLLDLGCGTGLVMRVADRYFKAVYGIDLSARMIAQSRQFAGRGVAGDIAALPFADESLDAVTCFAVLHHLYDHRSVFAEAYRVLRPGGLLYTDHDLDALFRHRFYWPLQLYRRLFDLGRRYLAAKGELSQATYDLSEWHAEGIEVSTLVRQLEETGFTSMEVRYHWWGLNRLSNALMGLSRRRYLPRGTSPLFSIRAEKPRDFGFGHWSLG